MVLFHLASSYSAVACVSQAAGPLAPLCSLYLPELSFYVQARVDSTSVIPWRRRFLRNTIIYRSFWCYRGASFSSRPASPELGVGSPRRPSGFSLSRLQFPHRGGGGGRWGLCGRQNHLIVRCFRGDRGGELGRTVLKGLGNLGTLPCTSRRVHATGASFNRLLLTLRADARGGTPPWSAAGAPTAGILFRCAGSSSSLDLRGPTSRGGVLWKSAEACRFRLGDTRTFWFTSHFNLWLPVPFSLAPGPFGRLSAEEVWFRGGPFHVAFLYSVRPDRPPRISISSPLHLRPAGASAYITLPYDRLLGLDRTYRLPSTCLFFCSGPHCSRGQEPADPSDGLGSVTRSTLTEMAGPAKKKQKKAPVKLEPSTHSPVAVLSDDERSSAGPARTACYKVALDAGAVGITVLQPLGADEFPLQDGTVPDEPIRIAPAPTSYVDLIRRFADEFPSSTGICSGANDHGVELWNERVCQALGPVGPAPSIGQPMLDLEPWAPAFRGVHCSSMKADSPGHRDFGRSTGLLAYMLGLKAGGIVLRIVMPSSLPEPAPEVSTHGYGILVTVYRKWLAPDALTVIDECVRQFLGVRLNKITTFWLDGVAAVRDDVCCKGLAGKPPVERYAGLGRTAGIRFHDELLLDVIRLCDELRSKVPVSTSVVCVLIPEEFIPQAATGQRADPNGAAWQLALTLGLSRVVLYTCVAALGWARLRGLEGYASVRIQVVYSGPAEMFSHLTGECPHALLSPELEDDIHPAVTSTGAAAGSATTPEAVVLRPNPSSMPIGDGCGFRVDAQNEPGIEQHLIRRVGEVASPAAPLVTRPATPDDLRQSTSPVGLAVAAIVSTQTIRQTAFELSGPFSSMLAIQCPTCGHDGRGPIAMCGGFCAEGPCFFCLRCDECQSNSVSPLEQLSSATCEALRGIRFPHHWASPDEDYSAHALLHDAGHKEGLCEQRCLGRLPSLLHLLDSLGRTAGSPSLADVTPLLGLPEGRCLVAAVLLAQLHGVLQADVRRIADEAAKRDKGTDGHESCDVAVLLEAVHEAEVALAEAPHAADWRAASIFAGEAVRSLSRASAAVAHVYWMVGRIPLFMAVGLAHVVELHTNGMSQESARDPRVLDSWIACVRDLGAATDAATADDDALLEQQRSVHIYCVFGRLRELAPQLSHSFGGVHYCFSVVSVALGTAVSTPDQLSEHGARGCTCDAGLWRPGGWTCPVAQRHVHEVCNTSATMRRLAEVWGAVNVDPSLLLRGGPARNRLVGSPLPGPLHPPCARVAGEHAYSPDPDAEGDPGLTVLDRGIIYPHTLTGSDRLHEGLDESSEGARIEAFVIGGSLDPATNSECPPRLSGLGSVTAYAAPLRRAIDLPHDYLKSVQTRTTALCDSYPELAARGPPPLRVCQSADMLVLPWDPSSQGQPGPAVLLSGPVPLNGPGARYHNLCIVALALSGEDGQGLVDLFNARADDLLRLNVAAGRVQSAPMLPAPLSPLNASLQSRPAHDAFDETEFDPATRRGPGWQASVVIEPGTLLLKAGGPLYVVTHVIDRSRGSRPTDSDSTSADLYVAALAVTVDIGHVDGHTDNRVTRVAATGVVVWFEGAEATEAAFRALHCESARHCWTQIELPATSSVALRRTALDVLRARDYLATLSQHLPARALTAPAGLSGVLDEHLGEGGSFENTDRIPAHWLARGAFSHDAESGERLVERVLFTLVRAGDSKSTGGLCTVCTKSSAASTSQKCGLRMASGVGGTGISDRDWHTIQLDGECFLLSGLFPACVSCALRALRDKSGKFQAGTCYPSALAKEPRPPKVVSGVLVWDFEREGWRTGTEDDHERAIRVGVSLWAGRPPPRFLDLQRALADTNPERKNCNPLDPAASMQSVWSLRLRVTDARRRAPEQRLLDTDAAARVGQPAEGSFAQLLALSELYCIRGVCELRLRDGKCDALLDLFVRNVGKAADEEANHVFPSLRRRWFNVSELLACLLAASAPESTEITPAVAEWVLLSSLVWLLGQFCTDREVPEETHAARRLGRELLNAFDNGFVWSASHGVTADFSAERVRCLEELRAAAEWDLRTWLRSLGIASAPPSARPEAIGVGHAWLGNDASLTQDDNAAPTSELCALDWHKCGLPAIHPRRHPGLLLQVWAHVPIQYPDAQAPLALLLFCLQVNCTEYRDLLARAWDGPTGELPDGSLLGHGVYTLLVELRRTMLGCLPGADPAGSFMFPAAGDVTAVADCMYGLCRERSWHLLLGLGSLLAVVEALFDALPLVPPRLSDPRTGEERSRPPPGVRDSHNGCRLTVRAGNTPECSLRVCLLEAAVRAGTLNGPATLMAVAPLLLVITVDRVDADGMGNSQCIRAELSLALDEVFPGYCHARAGTALGRENWYVLRAILGERRHPSGVHRPFALLPALGRRQRGAVAGWLLVLFGAAAFPDFFETEAEVEEVLGMPAGRCAIAFIYERRWSPAIMPSVRVPAVPGIVLVPPQQDDVAVRGPMYTSVVCPGPAAEHVRGLLQPRPPAELHSLLAVPADGPLVAGGPHSWSAPDLQLWGHSGPPSAPWISSKHESYLTLALRLPSHEQELRSVALFVAFASTLPAPSVLACDRPQMSAGELLLWTAVCHARATFLPPPCARDGISGRLPRADLHRQQYEAIADLGRLLRASGWRSLHDPPDLLLFLDCWLQLCGQPALALLPRASLPDYPQGPLPDRVPLVVQHELDALNVRLAEDDDSVGDTRALSFALQQDGDGVAIGLQSLLCLLKGARRPVPSVSHEPSSAQSLEHEPTCSMSLLETATHAVRIDAPSSELPDHHPDYVPVPDRETVQGLPTRSWADHFDFKMCRLCPSTSSTPVIRLCMVFRPLRSRHFGVTCRQCADAGEGHGCDWSDAHSDPHLVDIAGVLWQVISPGASCSACVDDPGSCRPAEEREQSPWFICLVLDDARWRLAQARDHERAAEQGCCLGDVSELPPIRFRTLRRLVQDSVRRTTGERCTYTRPAESDDGQQHACPVGRLHSVGTSRSMVGT